MKKIAQSIIVSLCVAVVPAVTLNAGQIQATWNGATSGNWTTDLNWVFDTAPVNRVFPNNDTANNDFFNVRIDNNGPAASVATLDTLATVDSLAVDADDRLNIEAGRSLTLVRDAGRAGSGSVSNDGIMNLTANNSFAADLRISGGDVVLGGAGTLTMSNVPFNRIFGSTAGDRLIHDVGHTIIGSGQLGVNLMEIDNRGTITANQTTALSVDPDAAGMTNSGLMHAVNGGTLALASGVYTNTAGVGSEGMIRADAATVSMSNAIVTGGNLESINGGVINLTNSSFLDGVVTNTAGGVLNGAGGRLRGQVMNAAGADIVINAGGFLDLLAPSSYTNDGTIQLNANNSFAAELRVVDGDVTLNGSGTLAMSDNAFNRVFGLGADPQLINAAAHTIAGSGQLGVNLMEIDNRGTITANQNTALSVNPNGSGMTNSGLMQSVSGGTLRLEGGAYTNTAGVGSEGMIRADAATVSMSNAVVTGGNLESINGGVINLTNSSFLDGVVTNSAGSVLNAAGGRLSGQVTNAAGAEIIINAGGFMDLLAPGSYTNDGTIQLSANNSFAAELHVVDGDVTLNGTGTLAMSNSPFNRVFGLGANPQLINAATHTIAGSGQLGVNLMEIDNRGTITANQNTALSVDPNAGGMTNSGLMEAVSGGTLRLEGGAYTNTAGVGSEGMIRADAATVSMSNAVVTGGNLESINGGVINLTNSSFLDGVVTNSAGSVLNAAGGRLSGQVTNAAGAEIIINAGGFLDLLAPGSYTNDGTIQLNANNSFAAELRVVDGDVTLNGFGTLAMSDNAFNRVFGLGANPQLINAAAHTIAGSGQLGVNLMEIDNRGTITANQNTALSVDPNGSGMTNSGLMQSISGGTLRLEGGAYTNTAGVGSEGMIRADAATVSMSNAVVAGGIVETVNGGILNLSNASLLNGVVTNNSGGAILAGGSQFSGTVRNESGATVRVNPGAFLQLAGSGSYTNDGVIELSANNSFSAELRGNAGSVTLAGFGSIEMNNSPFNRIFATTPGDAVINEAGHTIRGGGNIGLNQTTVVNRGTIEASQNTAMTVDAIGSTFTNDGTLRATGTGGITLVDTNVVNNGVVEIAAGSTVSASNNFTQLSGTTNLSGGMLNVPGQFNVVGGAVVGSGAIAGSATFGSASVLAPGASPGIIDILGDSSFSGLLQIGLEGTFVDGFPPDPGVVNTGFDPFLIQFDQINVFGDVTLVNGLSLDISLDNGFSPMAGDFFDILTGNSITADLNALDFTFPALQPGLVFQSQILNLPEPLFGVGNRDVLRISVFDAAAAVPEPSTIVFLGMGLVMALRLRKYRQKAV